MMYEGGYDMSRQKIIYFSVITILAIIIIYLLIKLYPVYIQLFVMLGRVFFPFIVASFISYLLYPILLKLHQYKINKGFAVIIIYLLFFSVVTFAFYKSFPIVVNQLLDLSEQLPQFIQVYEDIIYSLYVSTSFLPEIVHEKIDEFIQSIESTLETQIEKVLEKVLHIFDYFIILAIIPVLVFYFLKDFSEIKTSFKKMIPNKYHGKVEKTLVAIDESLGGYVRGQLIISSVVIFVTYIVYHTIHLKYALLLAVIMGLMNIIPYFGPIIGTIPALLIAMTTSWHLVIIVLITNIVIQILESSFLSPYIMGKSVRIHPIIIIFALLIGAEIGGVIGMIVAIPTVTIGRAVYIQISPKRQQCD